MRGVSAERAAAIAQRDELALELLIRGTRRKAIARELGISQSLLSISVGRIYRRCNVRNLIELGAWAQRNGRMQDER